MLTPLLLIVSCVVYSVSIPMRESPPSMRNTTIVNNTLADNGPYPLEEVNQSRNSTVAGNSTQPEPEFLAGQDPAAVDDYHAILEQNRENLYEWAERYGLLEQLQKYEKTQKQQQQQQSKQVIQQTTVTKANGTAVAPPASAASSSSAPAVDETTTVASADNTTTASGNSTTTTKKPNASWGTTVSLALLPIIVVQVL